MHPVPVDSRHAVVYPGWGSGVGTGRVYREGLYRYPSPSHPRTIFSLFLALRPYLRPNEAKSEVFHEVSQIGLRIDPELTQN